jgi:hypothetical protein
MSAPARWSSDALQVGYLVAISLNAGSITNQWKISMSNPIDPKLTHRPKGHPRCSEGRS